MLESSGYLYSHALRTVAASFTCLRTDGLSQHWRLQYCDSTQDTAHIMTNRRPHTGCSNDAVLFSYFELVALVYNMLGASNSLEIDFLW